MVKSKSLKSKQMRREQNVADEQGGRRSKKSASAIGSVTSSSASPIIKATNIGMEKEKPRVSMKKRHRARLLKKAKKTIKKLELKIAEKRGYTMFLKQMVMEETTVMGTAIQEMEAKLALMKMKNEMVFAKNECMEHFIASMLAIFEVEDALA